MTFTRKAAAEMRERVVAALRSADDELRPVGPTHPSRGAHRTALRVPRSNGIGAWAGACSSSRRDCASSRSMRSRPRSHARRRSRPELGCAACLRRRRAGAVSRGGARCTGGGAGRRPALADVSCVAGQRCRDGDAADRQHAGGARSLARAPFCRRRGALRADVERVLEREARASLRVVRERHAGAARRGAARHSRRLAPTASRRPIRRRRMRWAVQAVATGGRAAGRRRARDVVRTRRLGADQEGDVSADGHVQAMAFHRRAAGAGAAQRARRKADFVRWLVDAAQRAGARRRVASPAIASAGAFRRRRMGVRRRRDARAACGRRRVGRRVRQAGTGGLLPRRRCARCLRSAPTTIPPTCCSRSTTGCRTC